MGVEFSERLKRVVDEYNNRRRDEAYANEVLDVWHPGKILQRYFLVDKDSVVPNDLTEGVLVRTPLERGVLATSVHASLLVDLGDISGIAALCDTEYLKSDTLISSLSKGDILDLGSSMSPSLEKMSTIQADGLLLSPFENSGHGAFSLLDVPIIECLDYMENSPLGRAEWMLFYGELFGLREEADSLFREVETEYNRLCGLLSEVGRRPSLFCDLKQGSAWYVPGGNSYIGRMFADAGADYLFSDYEQSGSVPCSFETVYAKVRNADYWLIKYAAATDLTYQSVASDYSLYTHFDAWENRRIYHCNTFYSSFFEEIPFHPERMLRDLIGIFHPSVLGSVENRYYKPLK